VLLLTPIISQNVDVPTRVLDNKARGYVAYVFYFLKDTHVR